MGVSDVFVSQPDALKENLAGKLFVLAEIGGKKTDSRKIFNFVVSSLEDNYYNDEKILLRGKIEGLKIENIFEAALAKTNKNLLEFLGTEKLKFNPTATNITLGVIYESKLYFSTFGKNRSLLIYHRGEDFEVINVEASAADLAGESQTSDSQAAKASKLFSSVISGEIPVGSYFVFASEALPEYLSGKEMISIITKLPPIVAAEQIKNVLSKINTFVPFLGIIIKNTVGLAGQEAKEEPEENLSAHTSISSLNYTEQKTEQMLAPAGLVSFSKISKGLKELIKNVRPKANVRPKRSFRPEDDKKSATQQPLDLGKVKSLNLARADSFMTKEKISFKRKNNQLDGYFTKIGAILSSLFSGRFWSGFSNNLRIWFRALNKKNRLLFVALFLVVVIFGVSLGVTSWNRRQRAAEDSFNSLVAQITDRENSIDTHLLYNDEDGSRQLLNEAQALLNSLPREKKYQQDAYANLLKKLQEQTDRIQKVVKVETNLNNKVNDLSGLGVTNLVWANKKIYAAGGKTIYSIIPGSASSTRNEVAAASALSNPQVDNKGFINYWDTNKIVQFNLKTNQSSLTNISAALDSADGLTSFKIFNGNLYVIAKNKNQIYRYTKDKNGFGIKTDWLKDSVDLSQATDLAIDGNIYILKNSGEVLKLYKSQKAEYAAGPLSPALSNARKIVIGTKYVYVFDQTAKLLAVLGIKDGHLINQYQLSLNQPVDVAIDEAGRAAYFLDGEAIYKITLNQ